MENKQHFRKIDFLRGMAILSVFQAHFIWYFFPAYATPDAGLPLKKVLLLHFLPVSVGWGGVTVFILISGFLLHLGYLKDPDNFTLREFYSRRFWRVYPPYLVALLAFSLLLDNVLFTTPSGRGTFLLHIFSLQNLTARTFFSVNPTFWCLAAEVQIYGLYGLVLYGRKRWGIKTVLALTFLISVAWQIIGARVPALAGSPPWTLSAVSLWFIWVAGACWAEAYRQGKRIGAMLSRRDWGWVLMLLGIGFVTTMSAARLEYAAVIINLALMDWFLLKNAFPLQQGVSRLVITIGLCSFSLFLIHQPLIGVLIDAFNRLSPRYPGCREVNGLLAMLVIFLLSYAMYRLVEIPSIRTGNRLRARRA